MATKVGQLDPVTMQVVDNALGSICDDMFVTLQRVGRSPTATQVFDMSTGICDARGDIVGCGTQFGHVASTPEAMKNTLAKFAGRIEDGDIFVVNDPYSACLHMPDVVIFKPVFIDGVFTFFAVTVVHQVDIGGRTPGSMSHDSTDIYQEGLRLPPLKLVELGVPNETLWDVIEKNVRGSATLADMRAQCTASLAADRRLKELAKRYGRERLVAYCEALKDYSERVVRASIEAWPDGEYEFTDYIDEDGIDPDPVRIHIKLTVKGDAVIADYTGTSRQTRGSLNITLAEAKGSAFGAIRSVMGLEVPNNSGVFRPITVVAPPGCLVNMQHPASCAARGVTTFRMRDAWMGVLAQVVPDGVPAANEGGTSTGRFGFIQEDRTIKVMYDNIYGSPGGYPHRDAPDGLGTNLSNFSIEILERGYPARVRRYGFAPGTEGAGRHRGALGIIREWEFLQDSHLTFRSDRRLFPPYGLAGGHPALPSMTYLNPDNENRELPSKMNAYFKAGDVLSHRTAGGGGYGDPLERDPQRVLEDCLDEKLTAERAREAYGVVIDERQRAVDIQATRRLRREMRPRKEKRT
ncbi:MAG: hydantoinase B/oxoprolinase family protein [Chloroflexi bacterium]|nr:hydantoinase B/oxoprolinase family protein [Chloroflexota bacterium]